MMMSFMITHTDSGSLDVNWFSSTIIKSFSMFFGQTGRQKHGFHVHLVRPVHRSFGMGCLSYFVPFLIHMIQKEQEEIQKVEKAMKKKEREDRKENART